MDKEYKKKRVYRVFEKISQHYDGANYRISFGLQTSWKKMLTNRLIQKSPKDEKILDLCCGTGDIAIEIAKKRPDLQLIGADFSLAMLKVAKQKSCGMKNILWEKEDATKLSFGENQFAMATISFGLRNTSDYKRLGRINEEIKRVVSEIIINGLKDPRVDSLTSVTHVKTTNDLRYVNIVADRKSVV